MYELRILSGLHRGAALPLDDQPHLIGASDDADVVLVDDCIKAQHATLSRTDNGWMLVRGMGALFTADSNTPQPLIDLMPGDFARLGDVWVMVVDENAKWINPPPVPVDELLDLDRDGPSMPQEVAIIAPALVAHDAAVPPPVDDIVDDTEPPRSWSNRRFFLIPVAVLVLSAATYTMSAKNAPDKLPTRLELKLSDSISMGMPADKAFGSTAGEGKSTFLVPAKTKPVLSPDALQSAFRKRLANADLIKRFDIKLEDQSWSMQADLNEEETKRFERVLQGFIREHNITFPVNAKIVNAESMLPFKIRQVISGANASVVTQDGERLYVGEEYRGVRVVAIQDNRLTFAGKRKIEMNW
jgi:type III secretion protein D